MGYRADVPTHLLPKVGGFFLVPAIGAFATRFGAPLVDKGIRAVISNPKDEPSVQNVTSIVGTLLQAGVAYAAYRVSENDDHDVGVQAFARGGFWGAALSSIVIAGAGAMADKTPMVTTSGATSGILDKGFALLTAEAVGAVAASRMQEMMRPAAARLR